MPNDENENIEDLETENQNAEEKQENDSKIDKLIEAAVGRKTKELAAENKKLTDKLDKLQKEKLSDDELKKIEIDNKEAEIAERERRLTENENRLHAVKAIKAAGLDDGSEKSLELIDFVMGGTKDEIDEKVKSFGGLVNRFVKAEVDKIFKEHGRTPNKGGEERGDRQKENAIAAKLGKSVAEANEKSRSILNSYLGR